MQLHRRRFIKAAGASLTGLAGLAATETVAAADVPLISTREHFDDDANLTAGNTATNYDTTGNVPGVDVGCVGDLAVFVHGWDKKSDDPDTAAEEKIDEANRELTAAGYGGSVVGYTWDSDKGGGADYGWSEAKQIAQANGPKLAQFALDFKYYCPDRSLRLVCHSLGAQVVFSALRVLDGTPDWNDGGYRIDTIHPFGAATDNEVPTDANPETFDAIATEVGRAHNYHSEEDDVLQWIYSTIEFDRALGQTGAESGRETPWNYADHDVTDEVGDDHSGYLSSISPLIVSHMT
ncbi:alpha/beta hydrolase [Halegenticoccus tardaugens]|uniref:alpha/beta hydrolase n=1 Tax=Halegenticoccus tardaugens TaxID=2071624 RepID=UPI00100BA8B9|nr:alpha/beta hydrolase [Halegenticoccus tardaugens]